MQKFIAYRRVSTKKNKVCVGVWALEGQDAAIAAFTKDGQILKTYTEVESGKRKDRPELAKAIAHARLTKSVLVIAKLDRLSRNVAFLSTLRESELEFVACDNPHADKFTVRILAAVAEKEARDISARTKSALNAYKARGGVPWTSREPRCTGASQGSSNWNRSQPEASRTSLCRTCPHDARASDGRGNLESHRSQTKCGRLYDQTGQAVLAAANRS